MLVIRKYNGEERCQIEINVGSIGRQEIMKEDYVLLKFSLDVPVCLEIGDYVDFSENSHKAEFPFLACDALSLGKYVLTSEYLPSFNTVNAGYEYSVQFDAEYYIYKNKIFKLSTNMLGLESSWSSSSHPLDFLKMIIANMNSYITNESDKYSLAGVDGYDSIVNAEDIRNKYLTLSFSSTDIISALNMIAEACDAENKYYEWWFEGKVLYLGKKTTKNPKNSAEIKPTYDLVLGDNVESMSSSQSNRDYANKIFAFGSTDNITNRYRKHVEIVCDKESWSGLQEDDIEDTDCHELLTNAGYDYACGSTKTPITFDMFHSSYYQTFKKRTSIPLEAVDYTGGAAYQVMERTSTGAFRITHEYELKLGVNYHETFVFRAGDARFNLEGGSFTLKRIGSFSNVKVLYRAYLYQNDTQLFATQAKEVNAVVTSSSVSATFYYNKWNFDDFALKCDIDGSDKGKLKLVVECLFYSSNFTDTTCWYKTSSGYFSLETLNYKVVTKVNGKDAVLNPLHYSKSHIMSQLFVSNEYLGTYVHNASVLTKINGLLKARVPYEYFVADYLSSERYLRGAVVQNLMLPDFDVDVTVKGVTYNYRKEGYVMLDKTIPSEKQIEKVVVFDELKPTMNDVMGDDLAISVVEEEKYDNGEYTGEVRNFWQFKTTKLVNVTKKDFANDKLHIVFGAFKRWNSTKGQYEVVGNNGGLLNGFDFELNWVKTDKTGTTFRIIPQDYSGIVPNDTMYPKVGDGYNIYGLDTSFYQDDDKYETSGLSTLIEDAEVQLLEEAIAFAIEAREDSNTYTCKMMSDVIFEDMLSPVADMKASSGATFPQIGDNVVLKDENFTGEKILFGASGRKSRIIGIEFNLDKPYDTPTLTIGNAREYSKSGALEESVTALKVSQTLNGSTSIGVGNSSGSGSSFSSIGVDEVWVGSDEPQESNFVLWVDPESSSDTISDIKIDANNHLIVTTSSVAALLKAKINGSWTAVNALGSVNTGSNVTVTKCNQYPNGVELAKISIDGVEYIVNAPVSEEGADVIVSPKFTDGTEIATISVNGTLYSINAPSGSEGTVKSVNSTTPDANGNVSLYIPSQTTITGLEGAKHTHVNYDLLETITSNELLNEAQRNVLAQLEVVDGKLKAKVDLYSEGGISAYGFNEGSSTPVVSGTDEVYIGTTEPTDEDIELWVNPTVGSGNQFGAKINENGELILVVPDVDATLKAKYDNRWLNIAVGNGTGGGTSASWGVTSGVYSPLTIGLTTKNVLLKPTLVEGKQYVLKSTGWTEFTSAENPQNPQDPTTYTEGNGIKIENSAISLRILSSNSYLSLTSNGLGVDITSLKTGLGLGDLAYLGKDTEELSKYVKKSGDDVTWIKIGSSDSGVKLLWDSANNALKFEGNIYATGSITAFGAKGAEGAITAGVISLTDSKGTYEGSVDVKTINGNSIFGSGNLVIENGSTYTEGDGISIDSTNKAISVKLATSNSYLSTTNGLAVDITSLKTGLGLGSLAYKSGITYNDLTTKPSKSQLEAILELGDTYVKKSGDEMTGKLYVNGTENTNLGGREIPYSLRLSSNQLMEWSSYISWFGGDTLNIDGVNMPWYGIGAYQHTDGGHKMHMAGYNGICLHTGGNGFMRLYAGTGGGKLRIGDGVLCWDATNKAFYMYNAETGQNCNLYATGGISAYGIVSSTPLNNLVLSETLKANTVKTAIMNLGADETLATISNVDGVVTIDKSINITSSGNLGINGLTYADGGLEVKNYLKIGSSGTQIKQIVANNAKYSGTTNTNIAITVGTYTYYINAIRV